MKKIQIEKATGKGKDNDSVEYVLSGEINIETVGELKEKLTQAFEEYESIKVQVKDVENIDLVAAQLLYSALLTSRLKEKKYELEMVLPNELKSLFEHAGLDKIKGIDLCS